MSSHGIGERTLTDTEGSVTQRKYPGPACKEQQSTKTCTYEATEDTEFTCKQLNARCDLNNYTKRWVSLFHKHFTCSSLSASSFVNWQ